MQRVSLEISKLEIGYLQQRGDAIHVAGPIDFSTRAGELICLLGPNGVGKTTLLRTVAGIQPCLSGDVAIQKKSVNQIHKKKLAKLLSVVLTDRISHGNLTVFDLVSLGRIPHTGWFGNLRRADRQRVEWAIVSTQIQHLANKNIHAISDGERQKVMIARALAQDTPVILLDEPTAHLDIPNRIEIIRLLRKLAHDTGKAIIMSTHELDLALQAADKIWLMSMENSMFSGAPEDLVLNDIFGQVFRKEGIEFDKDHGAFKLVNGHGRAVNLEGDRTGMFWTKRALERQGFKVLLKKKGPVNISVEKTDHHWHWEYTNGEEKHNSHSIEELLNQLRREELDE